MIKDVNCRSNQSNSKNHYVTLNTQLVFFQVCVQSVSFSSTPFENTHCTIPNTLLQFKQLLQDCLQYDTVKRDAYFTYNCDPINTRERILETELPVTPRLGETQK